MNEILIVLVAELGRKFRSRLFWVATLGGMIGVAAIVLAPSFFDSAIRSSGSDLILAGPRDLRERAKPLLEANGDFRVIAQVDRLPAHVTLAYLKANDDAAAALALAVRDGRLHVDLYPRDLAAFESSLFRSLQPLAIATATGLPLARVREATHAVRTVHPVDRKFKNATSAAFAHGIAFAFVFALYMAIILASQSVMAAVAEEKTSRIAEILVSTIEPGNLLAGKTIAAAIVAVVQLLAWAATALALLSRAVATFLPSDANAATGANAHASSSALAVLAGLSPLEVFAFAAFFLTGYLQYATVYAAGASLVSRTEDLGSVTTPIILPVVAAFGLAQYALISPNAPIVVAMGFVPFFSPFVMFARIAIASVPAWQLALALAIDTATVVVCFYLAGRVYRVGLLLYGRLPSPRQMLATLRA